jgi:hypothetical protein
MKTIIDCLREYAGLKEAEQPPYLRKHGNFITTNAGVFTGIPNIGSVILADSLILFNTYSDRDVSEIAMKAYTDQKAACELKMESNYNFVDLTAGGNGDVVALAGVKGTSTNTTRTGPAGKPENVKYVFVDNAGEMQITSDPDKLTYGSLIVTFADPSVTVVKSGNTQLKITVGGVDVFVDLTTTVKSLIQNLKKGMEINSSVVYFNPNGISPIGKPESVIVPR